MKNISQIRSQVTILANQIFAHSEMTKSEAFKMAWREARENEDLETVRFQKVSGKVTVRVVDSREVVSLKGDRILMIDMAKFYAGLKNCHISTYKSNLIYS